MARPMSRALQERLKRMGRVYSSPVVAKRQHHCEEDKNDVHNSENSRQIGDHQLPEQLRCTSLQTRGQSGIDVAETLDLGCGDSQADSYCEEQLDSQLEPHSHSQATSEVELSNSSEQAEMNALIARTKYKVEKDSQTNTCGENSVTNSVKGAIDCVHPVEKLNEGLKVIHTLRTEKRASPQSPVIKIDRRPPSSLNTFRKEVHSVQTSLSTSNETKSCKERTVSNESSTLSDPYPVLKTCSISHHPNVSSLEGPSSSRNVSRTKRPKFPIAASSKRPSSPDVSSVKRPPNNLFDEGPESLQISGTKRPVVSPNNCSAKRQLSPNDCSAKRLVSPNNSAAKRPVSPNNSTSTAERLVSPNNSTVKRPVFPSTSTAERLVSPNSASSKRPVSPNNCSAKRPCVSPNVSSVERQESPNISKSASPPTDVMDSNQASQVASHVSLPGPSDDGQSCLPGSADDIDQLKKQRAEILTRLNGKEELQRKLNMVKMYRAKNNIAELQVLIDKWRTVSQDALQELVDITNDPKPSLKELIDHLHLDYKFIGFDPEEETFLPS